MLIKLKANIPEIILGAFLVIAVFAMGMSFQSSQQPPSNQTPTENADHSSAVVAADKSPNITDWLLVLFNGLLFGSNLLLWGVTRTAANAAKKAAEAADSSAKAVIVVERAYVYPIIVSHGELEEYVKGALVFYGDPAKDDVPVYMGAAEITFKFKNFGKTPAILKTAFVGLGINTIGAEFGVAVPEAVLGVLEETDPIPCPLRNGISRNQAQHINAYTGHIIFTGQVTFNDIWGNEHTTEFTFIWDKDIKRMTLYYIGIKKPQQPE